MFPLTRDEVRKVKRKNIIVFEYEFDESGEAVGERKIKGDVTVDDEYVNIELEDGRFFSIETKELKEIF